MLAENLTGRAMRGLIAIERRPRRPPPSYGPRRPPRPRTGLNQPPSSFDPRRLITRRIVSLQCGARHHRTERCVQFSAYDGPFANCGTDPLDRSGAHIAASEYIANAGFQRQRAAGIVRPPGIGCNVRSRQNEVLGVQGNSAVPEPGRGRLRADEEKDVADRFLGFFAGHIVAPAHALQLLFPAPVKGNDLGSGQYFDVVDRADAIDEILRHALCEAWPTH